MTQAEPAQTAANTAVHARLCCLHGCEQPVFALGVCVGHYRQMKDDEELRPLVNEQPDVADPEQKNCSFEGCNRPARSKRLCYAHYAQYRQGNGLRPLKLKTSHSSSDVRGHETRTCKFPDCDRGPHGKGYCRSHYAQLQAGKKLRPIIGRADRQKTCTFPGCDLPHMAKGYCTYHYCLQRDGKPMIPHPSKRFKPAPDAHHAPPPEPEPPAVLVPHISNYGLDHFLLAIDDMGSY